MPPKNRWHNLKAVNWFLFPNIQGSENPRCFQKFLVGRGIKNQFGPSQKRKWIKDK